MSSFNSSSIFPDRWARARGIHTPKSISTKVSRLVPLPPVAGEAGEAHVPLWFDKIRTVAVNSFRATTCLFCNYGLHGEIRRHEHILEFALCCICTQTAALAELHPDTNLSVCLCQIHLMLSCLSFLCLKKKKKNAVLPVTTATCLSWIPLSSGGVREMDEMRETGASEALLTGTAGCVCVCVLTVVIHRDSFKS